MEIIEILKTSTACVFVFFLLNFAPIFDYPRSIVYRYLDIKGGSKNVLGYLCRKVNN